MGTAQAPALNRLPSLEKNAGCRTVGVVPFSVAASMLVGCESHVSFSIANETKHTLPSILPICKYHA